MVRFAPFGSKPLDDLTADDLQTLRDQEIPEGLFIEYKSEWTPDKASRAVSSFANSQGGGTLIVGIKADDLIPVDVCGATFPSDPSETAEQVIRANIDPIPDYRLKAIPLQDGKHALVVEVSEGTAPPYIWVKKGQILVRNQTSSEPIQLTDRASIDRLFLRGERGRAWAKKERDEEETRLGHISQTGLLWTVPAVEDGLGHHELVFREKSFIDVVIPKLPVPFLHEFTTSYAVTYGDGTTFRAFQEAIFHVEVRIGVSGAIRTTWKMLTANRHPSGDPVLADFKMDDAEAMVRKALPFHRWVTEDLLGHRGSVCIGLKASVFANNAHSMARVMLDPLPIQKLDDKKFVEFLIRAMARSIGIPTPEPEPNS